MGKIWEHVWELKAPAEHEWERKKLHRQAGGERDEWRMVWWFHVLVCGRTQATWGAKLRPCLHHMADVRRRCDGNLMWMHFHVLLLQQENTLESFSRWVTTDTESLRRKLGSSKTWENIPRVPVVAIKHRLSRTYAGIQYWILLTSQRLNEIICVLASHASLLNVRISSLCSLVVAIDLTQYDNFRSYFPDTAQDLNSMDFIFLFFPLLFSSSHSKHCRIGSFSNKIFFRCQVSLQLQQEQYPSVLSFPFGSNNLWVSNRHCFAEEKKIIMNDLK